MNKISPPMQLTLAAVLSMILAFGAVASASAQKASRAVIAGQLLKSDGKPLAYTEIELVPTNARKIVVDGRLLATSSANGKFTFFDVPAGRYTLSVNFDEKPTDLSPFSTFFYPNAAARENAEIFEVNEADKVRRISFRLPTALVKRRVTGRIVAASGEPSAGAFVFIRDVVFDDSSSVNQTRADKNGNFSFSAFGDRQYQCRAILFEELPPQPNGLPQFGEIIAAGETDVFTPAENITNVRVVLKPSKRADRIIDKTSGK